MLISDFQSQILKHFINEETRAADLAYIALKEVNTCGVPSPGFRVSRLLYVELHRARHLRWRAVDLDPSKPMF